MEVESYGAGGTDNKLSISFVCPTNCVRRPISEMSRMLAAQGYNVGVGYPESLACPTQEWAPNAKLEADSKVKKLKIPAYYLSSLRYNFPKLLSLFSWLKKVFKADIVHLWEYWYPLSVAVIFYALFTGQRKKLIMTTDGLVGYSYKPKDPWWLVPAFKIYTRTLGWFLFRIPGTLTTYGKAMLVFSRLAGVPMQKLNVIGTGIHLDNFQNVSSSDVEVLRQEFGILPDEQVLLYLGMLSERKGIATVIEVGEKLLESGWKGKVIIVGDAHGDEDYLAMVDSKYKDRILFPGGRTDVSAFMKLADCFLLASEGEGLPGVVMEAMAASTACVATNEGCTPDLIDNRVNGFLVKQGHIQGYLDGVRKILDNSEGFGKKARSKIEYFSWPIVLQKYLDLYKKIVFGNGDGK
ncbi:glycosyltransferase family 4 protein [archaeon]|jgi:glycosyltransferase involved in cell wall biosynthesis|nr:glycosyltransferase family 4 protein [archaeon]MBT6697600.1 glycosyltransferase family 4 protein [archaeon]